jgi:polynucleotide 5'-kinase involved in rRNA processing
MYRVIIKQASRKTLNVLNGFSIINKMSSVISSSELLNPSKLATIREKPLIVICGCTGTGKTKLSIELAKWLTNKGKQCEIVNADAMQVCLIYKKNLNHVFRIDQIESKLVNCVIFTLSYIKT